MKVATFALVFCFLTASACEAFSLRMLLSMRTTTIDPITEPTLSPTYEKIVRSQKLVSARHPDCLKQIPSTSLFRGFMWPFYTFDSKSNNCLMIYGVTVRRKAPNVFSSYKDCRRMCCPNGWC